MVLRRSPMTWDELGPEIEIASTPREVLEELEVGEALAWDAEGASLVSTSRTDLSLVHWPPRLAALLDDIKRPVPARLFLRFEAASNDLELRKRVSDALLRNYPDSPEAKSIRPRMDQLAPWWSKVARADRIESGAALGALLELASSQEVPESRRREALVRARAHAETAPEPAREAAVEPVRKLLLSGPLTLREAATSVAAELGGVLVPELGRIARATERDLVLASVAALTRIESTSAEHRLVDILTQDAYASRSRSERLALEQAVIQALGSFGTMDSLPPLLQRSEGAGLRAPLADAALDAVRRIRARIPPGSPGALAVLGGGEGQLALEAGSELPLSSDQSTAIE